MIAATSPKQRTKRPNSLPVQQSNASHRVFPLSSPPLWEIGQNARAYGGPSFVAYERRSECCDDAPHIRTGNSRILQPAVLQHLPTNKRPREVGTWGAVLTSTVGPMGNEVWTNVRSAPPSHQRRHTPPAWTYHPPVSTVSDLGVNAGRRVFHTVSRARYPSAITTQHWQRTQSERSSQVRSNWSSSYGTTPRTVIAVPPEPLLARLQGTPGRKRAASPLPARPSKRPSGLDKLDLLCSATLEIGPLHDNPMGCSCPKSKCVALYCDCFKAGRRCDATRCSCLDCKNTVAESGPNGARTVAIRSILARNPRAFTTAGMGTPKVAPGQIACNCIRSKCLKLYCSCFQNGKMCDPNICTCVDCRNTDTNPMREQAIQLCLEKRPDAFETRTREPGLGCACKNNRCIRKYCECFRSNLPCSDRCTCRDCANTEDARENRRRQDEINKDKKRLFEISPSVSESTVDDSSNSHAI